jgi:4-hydroxybenzoate polyprenyltransferase
LLVLGDFPPLPILLLSIFTAFAAYIAIYALNDLVGIYVDREKFAGEGINPGYSVEASAMRYPLAQNVLSYKSGIMWMSGWLIAAFIGGYFLNPVIVLILLGAAVLEVIYCLLLKVTYLRTLVSGVVKTCGALAAIFAVNPNPSAESLLLVFTWLFFWEIGGQNIPADWNDTVEDKRVHAKTIPIHFGFKKAGMIIVGALSLAVITSALLPFISPAKLGAPFIVGSLLIGFFLLLRPAFELYRLQEGRYAGRLFDHASYYPLAQLTWITVFILANKFLL